MNCLGMLLPDIFEFAIHGPQWPLPHFLKKKNCMYIHYLVFIAFSVDDATTT